MNRYFWVFIVFFVNVNVAFNPEEIFNVALGGNDENDKPKLPFSPLSLLPPGLIMESNDEKPSFSPLSLMAPMIGSLGSRGKSSETKTEVDDFPIKSVTNLLKVYTDNIKAGLEEHRHRKKEEPKKERSTELKGRHVCVNEVRMAGNASEEKNIDSGEVCDMYRDASVCTLTSAKGKISKRIQYCCDGWTTTNIEEDGCLTEISDELLADYNITDALTNSTLLFTKLNDASFILPGIQNSYDWTDKQILETAEKQKFMVTRTTEDQITEVYLNCALKKETIRLEASQILKFDGVLKPAADSLLDIIEKTPELSTFNKALGEELRTFLKDANVATVFAFTNEAFEKLPEATKKQILQADGNDCVQEIMKHHITTSGSYCSNLPRHIESLQGESLTCRRNSSGILHVDEAQVIDSSGFALNGVVHIIDTVLVRENFLSWRDSLRLFNADMADMLEAENITLPVTIFVPPTSNNDTNTTETWDFSNFLVSGSLITDFDNLKSIQTDANSTIFTGPLSDDRSEVFSFRISIDQAPSASKNIRLGCSKFTAASIQSCKAVIHFLDKPLPIVTSNVEQFIENRKDLSMFAKIWKKANFTIKAEDKVTVFAPVDDAFSANEVKKIMRTEKSAMEFVKRHVVDSIICESDVNKKVRLIRTTMYESLSGQMLTPVTDDDGNVEINRARIAEMELVQSNGVVHILESFIEPPSLEKNGKISTQQIVKNPLSLFANLFG